MTFALPLLLLVLPTSVVLVALLHVYQMEHPDE